MNKKLLFLTLTLLHSSSIFTAEAFYNKGKRPAEEQAGPAAQEENKSRKINIQEQFFTACKTGDIEKVNQLLKQGVSLTETTIYVKERYATPLGIACLNGHNTVVQTLLAANIDPNTSHQTWGNGTTLTAFGVACFNGHNTVVQTLLAANVDPNTPHLTSADGGTITALGLASGTGNNTVVQTLLAANIDPNKSHETLANGDTFTALGIACSTGHEAVVERLLNTNVDPNKSHRTCANGTTFTALGIACYNGHNTVVQTLLAANIDPNKSHQTWGNGTTFTALGIACLRGHNTVVQTLLNDPRVSFKRVNSKGYNAYQMSKKDAIKQLIKERAIQEQSDDPIALEPFRTGQSLHFLQCCCKYIDINHYYKIHFQGNNTCPCCQSRTLEPNTNDLVYHVETRDIGTNTDNIMNHENNQACTASIADPVENTGADTEDFS